MKTYIGNVEKFNLCTNKEYLCPFLDIYLDKVLKCSGISYEGLYDIYYDKCSNSTQFELFLSRLYHGLVGFFNTSYINKKNQVVIYVTTADNDIFDIHKLNHMNCNGGGVLDIKNIFNKTIEDTEQNVPKLKSLNIDLYDTLESKPPKLLSELQWSEINEHEIYKFKPYDKDKHEKQLYVMFKEPVCEHDSAKIHCFDINKNSKEKVIIDWNNYYVDVDDYMIEKVILEDLRILNKEENVIGTFAECIFRHGLSLLLTNECAGFKFNENCHYYCNNEDIFVLSHDETEEMVAYLLEVDDEL
jgi:hypothetical protein